VTYCILGVAILLSQSPVFFTGVKFLAAGYLLYLGVQSIRLSFKNNQSDSDTRPVITDPRKAFMLGFLTNGLNPKVTLFFLALFTVVISPETPVMVKILYGLYLSLATFIWFALLSRLLGMQKIRRFMLDSGVWFERAMGLVLIFLAIQIAGNA
ncbi:MAG: lysine transporter LysE, partial [SAR86 cluster bacterium]